MLIKPMIHPKMLELGQSLMEQHLSDAALRMWDASPHVYNPYHNAAHIWLVVAHAAEAAQYGRTDTTRFAGLAVAAAAFHDYDHSGGLYPDDQNIVNALNGLDGLISQDTLFVHSDAKITDLDYEMIRQAIRSTYFDGQGFPEDPKTFIAECLRDADLCMIYTEPGRSILPGIAQEALVARDVPEEDQPFHGIYANSAYWERFLERQEQFLVEAPMFTSYGKRMKAQHLKRCLADLRQHLVKLDFVGN